MKLLLIFFGFGLLSLVYGNDDISDKPSGFYGDPIFYDGKMVFNPSFQVLNEQQYKQYLLFTVDSILGEFCSESTLGHLNSYIEGLETGKSQATFGSNFFFYTSTKHIEFCKSIEGHPTVPDANKKKIIKAYKEFKCNLNVDPKATPSFLSEENLKQYLSNCRSMTRSLTFREIFEYNQLKGNSNYDGLFVGSLYDQSMGTLAPGGGLNSGYGNGGYNLGQISYSKELEGITSSDDRTISEEKDGNLGQIDNDDSTGAIEQ